MEVTREDAIHAYRESLKDLTVNSRPLINMLTMLADDNKQHAQFIVEVITDHIFKCRPEKKLPVLYLIDSIMKNLPETSYRLLLGRNLVTTFLGVFEKVDEKARAAMYKLRQTWVDIVESSRLYKIDVQIRNTMDPAWPITAPVPEPTQTSTESLAKEDVADFPVFGTRVKSCPNSENYINTKDMVGTAVGHPKGRHGQLADSPAGRHTSSEELFQAANQHGQHSVEPGNAYTQSLPEVHEQCGQLNRYPAKTNITHTLSRAPAQTNTTSIHIAGGKDSPVVVSENRTMNQVTLKGNSIVHVSAISTVSKDKVVLEGGGKFEEGKVYMVRSPGGHSQKMVLQNGKFIPQKQYREYKIKQRDLKKNKNILSTISNVSKDKVALEGGGKFEEGVVYLVHSKDGQSQKMLLQNGKFEPHSQHEEYERKQKGLENEDSRQDKLRLNQITPKGNKIGSAISTVSKDKVALEGGGKFKEGEFYLVNSKDGRSQKMLLQNGKFVPYSQYEEYERKQKDLENENSRQDKLRLNQITPKGNKIGSAISTVSKDKVALEGGGKFKEGEFYLVNSKDGRSQKMLLQNGKLVPYSQYEEYERKQKDLENENSRQDKLHLTKSMEVKCVKEQQPVDTIKDVARNPTIPSSSNTAVRAPTKRKADDAHARQPGGKVVKIKQEGGGHIAVRASGTIHLTEGDAEMDTGAPPIHHSGHNTSIDKPAETPEKTEPIAGTSKSETIACTSKTEPIAGTSKTAPIACTSKTEPIAGRSTSKTKLFASSSKSKHSVGISKTEPIAGTSKTEPIASTSKTKLFKSTFKTKPIASTSQTEPIVGTSKITEKSDVSGVCTASKEAAPYTEMDVKEELNIQIQALKTVLSHKGPQTVPSGDLSELGQSSVRFTSPEDWELPELPVQELEVARELREQQTREMRELMELELRELRELETRKMRELRELEVRELGELETQEMWELRELELRELRELEAREEEENTGGLKSLQKNIWQLLKAILPDFDFGNQNNIDLDDISFFRWIIEFYFNEMK